MTRAFALVLVALLATPAWAQENPVVPGKTAEKTTNATPRSAGQAVRDTTRAIGHGTRDAAKAVGKGAREAASGVGSAVRNAWGEATGKKK